LDKVWTGLILCVYDYFLGRRSGSSISLANFTVFLEEFSLLRFNLKFESMKERAEVSSNRNEFDELAIDMLHLV
jgi:hypothetical protein